MSDGPPTEDRAVSTFLDYVALACIFGCVEQFTSGKYWTGGVALAAALIFHISGIKWPNIKLITGPRFAAALEWVASGSPYYRWAIGLVIAALVVSISIGAYRYLRRNIDRKAAPLAQSTLPNSTEEKPQPKIANPPLPAPKGASKPPPNAKPSVPPKEGKQPVPVTPPASSGESGTITSLSDLARMSNVELKANALVIVSRIRVLQEKYKDIQTREENRWQEQVRIADKDFPGDKDKLEFLGKNHNMTRWGISQQEASEFNNEYFSFAAIYQNELARRYTISPVRSSESAYLYSYPSISEFQINDIANDLEMLAKGLSDK